MHMMAPVWMPRYDYTPFLTPVQYQLPPFSSHSCRLQRRSALRPSGYCCVRIEGRRRASAEPFNLSHWPSRWHPCREQQSFAARTASPSSVHHADSSDALGQKALDQPFHASDIPPSRAPQDFCIDSQCALNGQCIAATGAPLAWDCGFDFRRHNTVRNSIITHKGGNVTWDNTSKNDLSKSI
jgi:hypothetical protein